MSFQPKIMLLRIVKHCHLCYRWAELMTIFQGFHNGNMEGGPEGEGRLDRNSQIFFSVCTCFIVPRGL
nr:hypothetical protein CFP56_16401 [Quercus suber]